MIIANTQQTLTTPEACDLVHLILRQVQLILNEPRLLFLHLHDQLYAAGVKDALAVAAALQTEQVLHTLSAGHRNTSQTSDRLYHFKNKTCGLRVGRGSYKAP